MAANKSAFEEALSSLGNKFQSAKSTLSSSFSNLKSDYSSWSKKYEDEQRQKQQKVKSFLSDSKDYFNPEKAATGKNFWTSPTANKLVQAQTSLIQSRPAQDFASTKANLGRGIQDFSNLIKTKPKDYFNPEQAASGPNFWTSRPAQDLAGIQTNLNNAGIFTREGLARVKSVPAREYFMPTSTFFKNKMTGAPGVGQIPEKPATETLDWKDKIIDIHNDPTQLVPFLSSAMDIGELTKLLTAANRMRDGTASEQDLLMIKDFVDKQNQDSTFGYKVLDVVSMIPAFAGELYATGGIATAGKISATKGLKYLLTKGGKELLEEELQRLGPKIAVNFVGRTLQTPVAGATRIAANTITNQIQSTLTVEDLADKEDYLLSFAKAFGGQWVETLSEFSGGIFNPKYLPTPIRNKIIKSTLFNLVSKLNPARSSPEIAALFAKTGYNGVIAEMMEERVGEVGYGILTELGLGDQPWRLPSGEQLLVELVSFSVPGVAGNIYNKVSNTTPPGTPPTGTISEETIIQTNNFAVKRLMELNQKANGQTVKDEKGKDIKIEGQVLTSDEIKERNFLNENIDKPEILAKMYGITAVAEPPVTAPEIGAVGGQVNVDVQTGLSDLYQEAKKYKSAEEFEYAMSKNRPFMRPEPPDDIKLKAQQIVRATSDRPRMSAKNFGKEDITIYRTGDGPIKLGDYVYATKGEAQHALDSGQGVKIYSKNIKANDLIQAGSPDGEYFYAPKDLKITGLTDIYNQSTKASEENITRSVGITPATTNTAMSGTTAYDLTSQYKQAWAAGDYAGAVAIRTQLLEQGRNDLLGRFADVPDIKLDVTLSHSTYFTEAEPTLIVNATMPKESEAEFIRRIAVVASDWGQRTVHISEKFKTLPEGQVYGKELESGFTFEPEVNFRFSRPLTDTEQKVISDRIQKIGQTVNEKGEPEGGLAGSTFHSDNSGILLYNISKFKNYDQFNTETAQIADTINGLYSGGILGVSGETRPEIETFESARRILVGGLAEDGATRNYEQLGSYVPSTDGSYRIQVEESPYNLDKNLVDKELRVLLDESEYNFLARDPGTIVTADGRIAVGRQLGTLIEAVEKDGKVQDITVFHEASHLVSKTLIDPKYLDAAIEQKMKEGSISDRAEAEEQLMDGILPWIQNGRTGVSGKIKIFFEKLYNAILDLIGKKNHIDALFQEMVTRKRAQGVKSGQIALSYRDAHGVSVNGVYQPNLTAKIIQTLINEIKGGETGVTSLQHIENLTNRGGLKQVERELAREVANRLAVDGKVNVAEFIKEYKKGLLPLEMGKDTAWERIVLPDEVRGDINEYYERIYSSPFETTLGKHFRNFPNYFAHVRVEDMSDTENVSLLNHNKETFDIKEVKDENGNLKWQTLLNGKIYNEFSNRAEARNQLEFMKAQRIEEGGTRRIIEIQSDLFQIPTEDFERQFVSPYEINKFISIMDNTSVGVGGVGETVERVTELTKNSKKIIEEAGLDKRHTGAIQGMLDEMKRRLDYTRNKNNLYEQQYKNLSPEERAGTVVSSVEERIASEKNYIETLKAREKLYSKILKQLPETPAMVVTADKLLRPYKNVWFERIIKEEINKAVADGKEKIQIPTGETIAKIEGYIGAGVVPQNIEEGDSFEYGGESYMVLKDFGDTVTAVREDEIENRFDWEQAVEEQKDNEMTDRVTYEFDKLSSDSVVDIDLDQRIHHALSVDEFKKYKTNPVEYIKNNRADLEDKLRDVIERDIEERYPTVQAFATEWPVETGQSYYVVADEIVVLKPDTYTEELSKGRQEDFDIEELSDDQKTIYNRYQNEYPKYLKRIRPDLKEVTDENGITWWETKITKQDQNKMVEAFRVENKKTPRIEEIVENTEDFWLAMDNLRRFRGYKVDMYRTPTTLTDEELNMEALAKSRGYQPIPAETVEQIAPEAMERINHLNDVRAELSKQNDDITDVTRNYDFYTKRFGKLMYRKELTSLKKDLNGLIKDIDKEIKLLQKQTVDVEVPAPTNQELGMQALERSRNPEQIVPETGEPLAVTSPEEPPVASSPQEPTGPEGFEENAQKELLTALKNKAKVEGLPADLSSRSDKDKFNTILSYMIGQHDVARIIGTEMGEKLLNIPREKGLEVIFARQAGGSSDPEVAGYVNQVGNMYEQLYTLAKENPQIDIGYLENYITQIWKGKMEDVANSYKQWKTKFKFANKRIIPDYKDGMAMKLEMKYDHPAPIVAEYVTKLYQTIANIEAFQAMRNEGLLIPYAQARKLPGYMPVVAPGIRRSYTIDTLTGDKRTVAGDYYAPKSIANTLNRVFSPHEPTGAIEKGFYFAGGISGVMQDIGLSGGLPYTPLNAWTFGQTYREVATSVGGLLTSPVYSLKKMGSLIGATLRPLIPGASMKFFKDNVGQIKKMVANNIKVDTLYTVENLMGKGFWNKFISDAPGLGEKIKGTWKKGIFDATFRKFMPMVQISMFNQIEAAGLKKGYSSEQAIETAASAVKSFYGMVSTKDAVLRSQLVQDGLTTFFFAPRYRETMARAWVNTLLSAIPFRVENKKIRFSNPLSLENRTGTNLLIGSFLVYAAYNMLNMALTGKRMKDNPPGSEDKLLIPMDDGYTIGIPLFPSTGTVVRYGIGFLKQAKEGDFEGMVDQGKNLLSFMIRPPLDAVTNQDYYGRQIYADNDTADVKYKKTMSYIALQYNHPWVEALVNQKGGWFLGKEYKKKPGYQNMLEALEAPTRFYESKSLASRYYYENLKQARERLSPEAQEIWDDLHKQGGYFFDVDDGLVVYDKRQAMANALNRLRFPELVEAETWAAVKTAQEQGTPISPFYALDPEQQEVVLVLKSFYPGDPQYKVKKDGNIGWLQPYWDETAKWSKEMIRLGVFEDKSLDSVSQERKDMVLNLYLKGARIPQEISDILNTSATGEGGSRENWTPEEVQKYIVDPNFIQPTAVIQAKLDYYNTLPNGTGDRSRYVNANPDVKAYFDALTEKKIASLIELGLDPAAYGYGGYGGYGSSGWGDYQKKVSLKIPSYKTPTPTKIKSLSFDFPSIKTSSLMSNIPNVPSSIRSGRFNPSYSVPNLVSLSLPKSSMPSNLSQLGGAK